MRVDRLPIRLTISFPFDHPDKNGNVYSQAAVEKALESLGDNHPILFCGDKPEENARIIGHINEKPRFAAWDMQAKTCTIEVDGVIYYGGTECIINETKDGVITDFEIVSFGLST